MTAPTDKQVMAGYEAILPDLDLLTDTYVPAGDVMFFGNVQQKIHDGLRNDPKVMVIVKDAINRCYVAMEAAK